MSFMERGSFALHKLPGLLLNALGGFTRAPGAVRSRLPPSSGSEFGGAEAPEERDSSSSLPPSQTSAPFHGLR